MMENFYLNEKTTFYAVLTTWIVFLSFPLFLMEPAYQPLSKSNAAGLHQLKTGAFKDIPTQNSPININLASKYELIRLNGIGPKLAERIIVQRDKKGKFKDLRDLSSVKGLGEKKLDKIKEQICF